MNISDFDYELPDGRIAKFPAEERDASKLLVWQSEGRRRDIGSVIPNRRVATCRELHEYPEISETRFCNIGNVLPSGSLLVFNNTRVVRARLVMHKAGTTTATGEPVRGARIEILCLEPRVPADYEQAFAAKGSCEWDCMVGNLKKWVVTPTAVLKCGSDENELRAWRKDPQQQGAEQTVCFEWDGDLTFGELLERLGRMPIPPYLGRDSEEVDNTRYQTVYSRFEGSVAAPTAGLHFTPELIERLKKGENGGAKGIEFDEVTLHVGAGTFLPVKTENALEHPMHTEHFEVTLATIEHLLAKEGHIIAVGTTSVRTLESLAALARRISQTGSPEVERPVGQFEPYDIPAEFTGTQALQTLAEYMRTRGMEKLAASTRIMITPGFIFRITDGIVTNFHQPKSTLLLLISAFTDRNADGKTNADHSNGEEWRRIYDYALSHEFRFLSYGDSSLLLRSL